MRMVRSDLAHTSSEQPAEVRLVWPGKPSEPSALYEAALPLRLESIENIACESEPLSALRVDRPARSMVGIEPADCEALPLETLPLETLPLETLDMRWRNLLIHGDNLAVMSALLERLEGKIDLIYVDPPFATGQDMTLSTAGGNNKTIEVPAYRDRWHGGISAILTMLYPRFVLMRRLLSDRGLLFAHFDDNAGHEVKLLLDEVFGSANKRGEIVWQLGTGAKSRKFFSIQHNYLWVYSKGSNWCFNADAPELREPFAASSLQTHFRNVDRHGRRFRVRKIAGKQYYYYADEGRAVGSVWTDISSMMANSPIMREATGYPTQKPLKLVDRILAACTKPGDLVADFFCGSGTSMVAAQCRGLKWIGCDSARIAIHTCVKRLITMSEAHWMSQNPSVHAQKFSVLSLHPASLDDVVRAVTGMPCDRMHAQSEGFSRELLRRYGAVPLHDQGLFGTRSCCGERCSDSAFVVIYPETAAVQWQRAFRLVREGIEQGKATPHFPNYSQVHLLAWDFGYGPHDQHIKMIEQQFGMKLHLIQIPRQPVSGSAAMVLESGFVELPIPVVQLKQMPFRAVTLTLRDYIFASRHLLPQALQTRVQTAMDLVDGWSVDPDYDGVYQRRWYSYTARRKRKFATTSPCFTYEKPGKYTILVKVTNIFGSDSFVLFNYEVQ